jgi:hypothetical protein
MDGLSIALIDDQDIAWGEAIGCADRSSARKSTAARLNRAGTVSSLLKAIAVMQPIARRNQILRKTTLCLYVSCIQSKRLLRAMAERNDEHY